MPNKAFVYRLYPSTAQKDWLMKNIGCCRYAYNLALGWRKAAYDADGTSLTYEDTAYGLARAKAAHPWLKEADSAALQQALRHLNTAFRKFFHGEARFPRFKSRKRSRLSYTTPMNGGSIRIGNGCISLPKAGTMKAVLHREIPEGYTVTSATVSCESDGTWYCSVLCSYEDRVLPVSDPCMNAVGIDYASNGLGQLSDGDMIGSPQKTQLYAKKLARAQKKLARMQGSRKGEEKSANWKKQALRVNRIHRKIANSRKDHLHKASLAIAKRYDLVGVEDLNMRALSNRGFGNGKATMDNGFGLFLAMLAYKLSDRGKVLIRVGKFFPSSQLCHDCGARSPEVKDLRIRSWDCPVCGLHHDRDLNAALNIRDEAVRIYKESLAV